MVFNYLVLEVVLFSMVIGCIYQLFLLEEFSVFIYLDYLAFTPSYAAR